MTFSLQAVQDIIILQIRYLHRTWSGSPGIRFMGESLELATIAAERQPEADATFRSQVWLRLAASSPRHFPVASNNGFQL